MGNKHTTSRKRGASVGAHDVEPAKPPLAGAAPGAAPTPAPAAAPLVKRRRHHHSSDPPPPVKPRSHQALKGIITASTDSVILSVNDYVCRMFGYQREELEGERLEILMPSPYREQHDLYVNTYLNTHCRRIMGKLQRVEGRHKDGTTFNMFLHVSEMKQPGEDDDEGELIFVASVEKSSGMIVIDEHGIVKSCDALACALFGYSPLEIEGFNVSKLMPDPHATLHDAYIQRYLETGQTKIMGKTVPVQALHKTGAQFPISLQVSQVTDSDGRLLFRGVVDSTEARGAVLTFDHNGVIRSCTNSFKLMFGYEKEELVNQSVTKLVPEEIAEEGILTGARTLLARRIDGTTFKTTLYVRRIPHQLHEVVSPHGRREPSTPSFAVSTESPTSYSGGCPHLASRTITESFTDPSVSRTTSRTASEASLDAGDDDQKYSAIFTPWLDGSNEPTAALPEGPPVRLTEDRLPANDRQHPALRRYKFEHQLGKGASGEVYLAVDQRTNTLTAIKIVSTEVMRSGSLEMRRLHNEINVLKICDHDNIVRLLDVIETKTHLYLVMENVNGGDLRHYWQEDLDPEDTVGAPEVEIKPIFKQVALAIRYLHSHGIVHRDIKLDNIMTTKEGIIKLVDFGYATPFERGKLLNKFCGTPYYASPEIFRNVPYSCEVDVWSLGIVLFILVTGHMPFETPQAIVRGVYTMPLSISGQCEDLLRAILVTNGAMRPDMDQVLVHPWLEGVALPAGKKWVAPKPVRPAAAAPVGMVPPAAAPAVRAAAVAAAVESAVPES